MTQMISDSSHKETMLLTPLSWMSTLQNYETMNSYCSSTLFVVLCYSSPSKRIQEIFIKAEGTRKAPFFSANHFGDMITHFFILSL